MARSKLTVLSIWKTMFDHSLEYLIISLLFFWHAGNAFALCVRKSEEKKKKVCAIKMVE